MATTYNFPAHIKGDTFLEQPFVYKLNGVVIDLTGGAFRMMIKRSPRSIDSTLTLTDGSGITVTDAVNGAWKIDSQIIDIQEGTYYYDVQFTYASGQVSTYLSGEFEVTQDITT